MSPTSTSEYCGVLCERLLDNPQLGRSRDELINGLRSIPVDPHTVFYRIARHAIEIIRVIHQREDIDSIFD